MGKLSSAIFACYAIYPTILAAQAMAVPGPFRINYICTAETVRHYLKLSQITIFHEGLEKSARLKLATASEGEITASVSRVQANLLPFKKGQVLSGDVDGTAGRSSFVFHEQTNGKGPPAIALTFYSDKESFDATCSRI